jgi:protein disulfide-isomerase A6
MKVVIAKVDADSHRDLGSRYGVTGFPTLKWFGKDSKKEPAAYEHGRLDLFNIISYMIQRSSFLCRLYQ